MTQRRTTIKLMKQRSARKLTSHPFNWSIKWRGEERTNQRRMTNTSYFLSTFVHLCYFLIVQFEEQSLNSARRTTENLPLNRHYQSSGSWNDCFFSLFLISRRRIENIGEHRFDLPSIRNQQGTRFHLSVPLDVFFLAFSLFFFFHSHGGDWQKVGPVSWVKTRKHEREIRLFIDHVDGDDGSV